MKDKVKGLVVGLAAGMLLSGSVAWAAGTSIDVVFKQVKFMIDGAEKKVQSGQPLVYEGLTYVPISFAADLMGRDTVWDAKAGTITFGAAGSREIAAYHDGVKVTVSEFNQYMAVVQFLNPSYAQYANDPDYRNYMLRQYVSYRLLNNKASDASKAAAKADAAIEFAKYKNNIAQQAGNVPTALATQLAAVNLKENNIQDLIQLNLTAFRALDEQITDTELKTIYEQKLAADASAFTNATVRHILIGLTDPEGKTIRTLEEAEAKAKEIRAKLIAGEDFAALAKSDSDDQGSKDNGGQYVNQPVSNWVIPFKNATATLPIGEISEPVKTDFGYHIIKVEARTTQTLAEAKAGLIKSLEAQKYDAYVNTLPQTFPKTAPTK